PAGGRWADARGASGGGAGPGARLEELAAEATTPVDAAEALYGAAALELSRERTRDAGIAKLCVALEKSPDLDRASTLVEAAGLTQADRVKILPLYERIARSSGDERLLLDYLERRGGPPAPPAARARAGGGPARAPRGGARPRPLPG